MTPNPTLRPFVLGAVFFLAVLAAWPTTASRGERGLHPARVAALDR